MSRISTNDILSTRSIAALAPSPSGADVAAVISYGDWDENRTVARLGLLSRDGDGSWRPLSDPSLGCAHPAWRPDGAQIAFTGTEKGGAVSQVYIASPVGGEPRKLTSFEFGAFAPKWLPNGRELIVLAWLSVAKERRLAPPLCDSGQAPLSTGLVWDKGPVAFWDHYLPARKLTLYRVDAETGDARALMSDDDAPVEDRWFDGVQYALSPDGLEVAFPGQADKTGRAPNCCIYVVPAQGGAAVNLTADNPAWDRAPAYSPDGTKLAWLAATIPSALGGGGSGIDRLTIIERTPGKISTPAEPKRVVADRWNAHLREFVWSPDSRSLVVCAEERGTRRLYRIALTGGEPQSLSGNCDYFGIAASQGGAIVCSRSSFSTPPEASVLSNGAPRAISSLNAALETRDFAAYESVTYEGARGDAIQMWVLKPPHFDRGKRYPLLLLLHGGPHAAITNTWRTRWNAQLFAAWGYVVAWHNFHGSSGFGEDFSDSLNTIDEQGKPGWLEFAYQDSIAAADWFAAQSWIDPDRMAAVGGSYGGFLACAIAGKAHPFKAFVAHAPVYNQVSQMAADYAGKLQRWGDLWDARAAWDVASPHMLVQNVETPILITHGLKDLRVPASQSLELFHSLQARGVRSRLVLFPDEHHWILKPHNEAHWCAEVRAWVEHFAPPNLDDRDRKD